MLKRRDILILLAAIGLMTSGGLAYFTQMPAINAPNLAVPAGANQPPARSAIGRQAGNAANPIPRFRDASVHDPSVIKVGDTFYVFGSHLAAAKTRDFLQWDMVAGGVDPKNPLFDNVLEELKEAFAWAQAQSLWAPDVIQLKDGRFYMYYNATIGNAPRSALGIAVADRVEGPYKDQGIILKSGMWGQPGEDGAIYDPRIHPNVVDPQVFFDHERQFWMLYGSYSGGLFILKMDATTGKPLPGQGYGKKLTGGNHTRIEAGYILYHPRTKFYYLFLSFGGLAADGGYNIRVARAERPDGPYFDAEGNDMINAKSEIGKPFFDDRSIEPYGVKLMGNFLFERKLGEPGTGIGTGYVSPGHNSAYHDPATGRTFLIFHTRFPQQGEGHQIRVHLLFMNQDGWPVVAPHRYAGETAGPIRERVAGFYKYVNHGKAISAAINRSRYIRLEPDGRITGAASGAWKQTGDNGVAITVDGQLYNGVLARQWEPDSRSYVLTFSALSKQGVALWGSRMPDKTDAQIVADVRRALDPGDTDSSIITNRTLPTEGVRQSHITWVSSNPKVITNKGVVIRPAVGAGNAPVTLTATITSGTAKATKRFTFRVKEKSAGGLVAHYAFDGSLKDNSGRAGAGTVTGNRIDSTGGRITFAPGVRGRAAAFDGSSGIRLPGGLIAGNAYTVSLWVKPAQSTENTPAFFGARDRDNWVSLVPRGHSGANNDAMVWSGTAWYDAGTGMKIPLNEWTHLCFAVQAGNITVYVDGAPKFSGTNFPDVLTTTTGAFALGVNWWDVPYKGLMDDLRVYESALTAKEIAALARKTP